MGLSLSAQSSDNTYFRILPSFQYQKDSQTYIFYGDDLLITHDNPTGTKIPYMTFLNKD
jgi:hypothetical protein